jgi:hypothetical protein
MRCDVHLSILTSMVTIVLVTPVGADEAVLCGSCYAELIPPMAQIEIVRVGRSVDSYLRS